MSDETALPDLGDPISYIVLSEGAPVYTREGTRTGTVNRVLAVVDDDVFDGLLLDTDDGLRFVDAANVDTIYERGVVLALSDEEARHLPDPDPSPAQLHVSPDDVVPETPAQKVGETIRKAWLMLSGKYWEP
jgi:hypothetical protein